jgi:hypothetical protein
VPLLSKKPPKVMGPATGFHRNDTPGKLGNVIDQRLPTHRPAHDYRARFIDADYAARVLAQIHAKDHNIIGPLLSLLNTGIISDAGEKGRAIP